jgi:hypothetical protein
MNHNDRLKEERDRQRERLEEQTVTPVWPAVLITTVCTVLLELFGVIAAESYGFSLFIVVPSFAGFFGTLIYSRNEQKSFGQCVAGSILTFLAIGVAFLVFGIEGLICIIMAAPLILPLGLFGTWIAYLMQRNRHIENRNKLLLPILFFVIPILMGAESALRIEPPLTPVSTEIRIDSPAQDVWNHVVTFSTLPEPTEWLFLVGVAHPTHATIDGHGENAIRYCNFSTGSFVEPITTWDEPYHLAFTVEEQPMPMKELSPYDIRPPHLNETFRSYRGEFRLIPQEDGSTILRGTTWYTHDLWPQWYWSLWSDHIIHTIHNRVLQHIKHETEAAVRGK